MSIAPWLPSAQALTPFYEGVERYVAAHLTRPHRLAPSKSILDPVVGYVHLAPWQIAILDTPLFQRMRSIRQLGLAYLVFPTLGYSRFEHTIGVLGRLSQVLSRLRDTHRALPRGPLVLDAIKRYEKVAGLAALFHDVGHCLFSHVSERVISNLHGRGDYPAASVIQRAFTDHFQRTALVPIAEVFSLAILGSPSMLHYASYVRIPRGRLEIDPLEAAGRLILGIPLMNDPESVFVAQLLSSGLDIDKLDYMSREAHFSGIRLEIDIERVLDKLRVFELPVSELPSDLSGHKLMLGSEKPCLVLGLARGGQFAFEEFCLSRVSLYEKIYLHQKVRAAEAHLSHCLDTASRSWSRELQEAHRWLDMPESILNDADAAVPIYQDTELFQMAPRAKEVGLGTFSRRALLHRAFAFGPANCLSDPLRSSSESEPDGPPSLRLFGLIESQREEFVTNLRHTIAEIAPQLKLAGPSPDDLVVLDLPRFGGVQQGQRSIHLEHPRRIPIRWTMPIDRLVDYYQRNRALAYVFAQRRHCPIVLLAMELLLYRSFRAYFAQEGVISEAVVRQAELLRRRLADSGTYASARVLLPFSSYLRTAAAQDSIQQVARNLADFAPLHGSRVTITRVSEFIAQFPEDLQEAALEWAKLIEVVRPEALAGALRDTFRTISPNKPRTTALAPLGGFEDSAAHLIYPIRDLMHSELERGIPPVQDLGATPVDCMDRVIVFDDNINSGLQTLNIMAEWMREKLPPQFDLGERHVFPLDLAKVARLRDSELWFVYAVGTEGSEHRLREMLTRLLRIDPKLINVRCGRVLRRDQRSLTGDHPGFRHARKRQLLDFIRGVGIELMEKENHPHDEAERRALGYSNAEAMIVFPYNVPVMTVTPLWCRGSWQGQEWIPLVERRRRVTDDGRYVGEDS